jgi:hypothetical protein
LTFYIPEGILGHDMTSTDNHIKSTYSESFSIFSVFSQTQTSLCVPVHFSKTTGNSVLPHLSRHSCGYYYLLSLSLQSWVLSEFCLGRTKCTFNLLIESQNQRDSYNKLPERNQIMTSQKVS